MRTTWATVAMLAVLVGLTVGSSPASAEFFGCDDQKSARTVSRSAPRVRTSGVTHELAAQASRPRITIYPRRVTPGRTAKRQCRAWLAKEYRVSGTVIVPRQQCWWE
jgi:hypothetical protein